MNTIKPGVDGATVITRSGRYFDFADPTPDMICLEDIAWGLANTCRFGGQTFTFYSVAQHSVLVSEIVPSPLAMTALLHDAAEAYIGDVVGPLKQLLPDFKAIEARVEAVIAARFKFTLPFAPEIKAADLRLLRTEQRDLTAGAGDVWSSTSDIEPLRNRINALSPRGAYRAFIARYFELGGVA